MNKYKVKITHVFSEVLDIEAANEDEAKQKAIDTLKDENYQGAPHYETTIPAEHWAVISEDQYNEMVKQFKEKMEQKEEDSNIITPNIITP
jgi:hypothetical protein